MTEDATFYDHHLNPSATTTTTRTVNSKTMINDDDSNRENMINQGTNDDETTLPSPVRNATTTEANHRNNNNSNNIGEGAPTSETMNTSKNTRMTQPQPPSVIVVGEQGLETTVIPGTPKPNATVSAATAAVAAAGNTTFWSFLFSPVSYLFGGSNTGNNDVNNGGGGASDNKPEDNQRKMKQDRMIRNKGNDKDAVVIKRRSGNSYTHWISDIMQRFGTDASKTVTDAFKEPLELLAKSPVLRTGEVLVVHSVDFESLRLDRLFKYLGLFAFFLQFSRMFLQAIFRGRSRALPPAVVTHPAIASNSTPIRAIEGTESIKKKK